jgi:hypothetical protein
MTEEEGLGLNRARNWEVVLAETAGEGGGFD